jgi:hypothetical protein
MSKFLTINALLLLLCGCGFGIAPWGDREQTFEDPHMRVLKRKGWIEGGHPSFKNTADIWSMEEIKRYWGEPDKRLHLDEKTEQWKYRLNGWRWHGAIVHVLIPIPVLIPFGYDYSLLLIYEGRVVSGTKVTSGGRKTYFCGFVPYGMTHDSMWGCGKIKGWGG